MKTIQLAICTMGALLAVACGQTESSNKPAVPAVPATLEFQKPAEGPELTKAQVAEMKNFFAKKPMMILPPGELVFPAKNADPAELAWKEEQLKSEDPNSARLLKEIRVGCQKSRPTSNVDATVPMDGVTLDNLKTGDHAVYSATAGLMGANCPTEFSAGTGASLRIDQADNEAKSATASASLSGKMNAKVASERYQKLLNMRGIIMDSKLSALGSTVDSKDNKALVSFDLSGSYLSLDGDLPYSMHVEYLNKSPDAVQNSYQAIAKTEMKFPNFSVRIDVRVVGNSKSQQPDVSEIYVNGRKMTQAQLDDLIGKQNPAGNPTATPVMEVLK